MLVQRISGDLLTYDAVLADRGRNVPAADLLDRVWSVPPLAVVTGNAPRPVPTWDNFSEAYEHLLASRKPLTSEQWAAAAGFAEQAGQSVPVAGILLGILVAAGWQDSAEGNELGLLKDDVTTWRTVFLPLARSLMRAKAVWAGRPLSKLAIDSLTGVGRCMKRMGLLRGDNIKMRYRRLDFACSRNKTEAWIAITRAPASRNTLHHT